MTLIGLEYLKHKENVRSNQAKEANTVLDIETRASTADKDRSTKVSEGSLDRASKENIAAADRLSKEGIASADRQSKEGIAQADRELKSSEAALDRALKVSENALDREHDILKQRAKNFSDAGYMGTAEYTLNPEGTSQGLAIATDILNRGYNDLVQPTFNAVVSNQAKNLAPKQQKVYNTNNTFNQQRFNQTNTVNQNYGSVMNQKFYD